MDAERERLIRGLRNWYEELRGGWDVPVIYASSFPVGAFLAPILAHTTKLTPASIKLAVDEATQLALAKEVSKTLIGKYQDVLSHGLKSGKGAYCSQPGGGMAVSILGRLRRDMRSFTQFQPTPNAFPARVIQQQGTLYVRDRLHLMYKRRVRYHAFLTTRDIPALGRHVACWPNHRFVVICKPPKRVLRDNNRRVHSTTRAAIKYPDGWEIGMVAGIPVPMQYIRKRSLLTVDVIRKTRNVEEKRALIELMGYEKWLKATNARCLDNDNDRDGRPRKLWYLELREESRSTWNWSERAAVNVLEVFNSTPEPDGTYKKYFLQVPEDRISIESALAWMIDERWAGHLSSRLTMRLET